MNIDCLSLMQEDAPAGHTDWAIHEQHGDGCPGDRATAPVVERLRLATDSAQVWRYNRAEGEFQPYPATSSSR